MKIDVQNEHWTTAKLDQPLIITIETVRELFWLSRALSQHIHGTNVPDGGPEQRFAIESVAHLEPFCIKYRGRFQKQLYGDRNE